MIIKKKIEDFYSSLGVVSSNWINQQITVKKIMNVKSCSLEQITTIDFDTVYLLGRNNAGFDSLTFFKDKSGSTIACSRK